MCVIIPPQSPPVNLSVNLRRAQGEINRAKWCYLYTAAPFCLVKLTKLTAKALVRRARGAGYRRAELELDNGMLTLRGYSY